MSLASWYHQQYSSWNRTRRIQQAPYLARTDTNASRAATAMAQNGQTTIVANMAASNEADAAANNNANGNQKKTQDPLFGPNIGAVTMGPPWTITSEKKMMSDDLTPEIVSGWVEKSKEVSTTLMFAGMCTSIVDGHLARTMIQLNWECSTPTILHV
ncbi:hypothetical protein BDQ12DRAFT_368504 [Crucibulum laeve]|uniref:Uncharacterized protein n=1 Tax=Crucibulum laeve TaxID=68775 RepID=A0A5C3LNK2_9AGAR|nr:hypothetical protein BDQ12DRAFT_368504 [Crucibulum laeve]